MRGGAQGLAGFRLVLRCGPLAWLGNAFHLSRHVLFSYEDVVYGSYE